MVEHGYMDVSCELGHTHWWWDVPVSRLPLRAPVTVSPEMTCHDAVAIMNREGVHQLPVVRDEGCDY